MDFLNYHHLRYFYTIATEGTLTGAAKRLRISQSALSIQLKKLEENLGCALFDREHKGLYLTEEGRMAMDYAEVIFRSGDELLQSLSNRAGLFQRVFRVGAMATLSRNFQIDFLHNVLNNDDIEVVIRTGSLSELLNQLEAHTLDMVLSNQAVRADSHMKLESHLIDTQMVSLVGKPAIMKGKPFVFPDDLQGRPLALPTAEASIRLAFDTLMRRTGVRPLIAVEADDMAILRLVARSSQALTLVPSVVVQDELRSGELVELHRIDEIQETFYANTAIRRRPNPIVEQLLTQNRA